MPDFEVRPARPEDREAVLAFCQQTWEWGDYLEYVWDEWLNNSQGKLFVATKDGQPVAVANMRMLNKTEAWFEGMRGSLGPRGGFIDQFLLTEIDSNGGPTGIRTLASRLFRKSGGDLFLPRKRRISPDYGISSRPLVHAC